MHYTDDWKSIFGDPTKFGFGALTVFFDVILLFQHVLYRGKNVSETDKRTEQKEEEPKKEELKIGKLRDKF